MNIQLISFKKLFGVLSQFFSGKGLKGRFLFQMIPQVKQLCVTDNSLSGGAGIG